MKLPRRRRQGKMISLPLPGGWNTTSPDILSKGNFKLAFLFSRSALDLGDSGSFELWNNHLTLLREILEDPRTVV